MADHLVIGTAGHIDHGKTALVGALTGTHTDRLPEERRRGISIDLGFALLDLGDGRTASIVDVPGHERFIKNMVAGVTGIDAVLMVIAADEGIMPQTLEHLDIVSLLGVSSGVVALTKVDLVWPEWLAEMRRDVRAGLEGTFLAQAPLVEVSATKNTGLVDLRRELAQLSAGLNQDRRHGPARLPIDRVFTVPGFGSVVTGTMGQGSFRVGDRLTILPPGTFARVRGLEIHGGPAEAVFSGQRVAVNLSGLPGDGISRGQVLTVPGQFFPVRGFAGTFRLLPRFKKPLNSGARVRLHTGTAEVMGRMVFLEDQELDPGASTLIQVRSEAPLVVAPGDRFIVRAYSPMETLGGGEVLDVMRRYRRFDRQGLTELRARAAGDMVLAVDLLLNRSRARPMDEGEVAARTGIEASDVSQVTEKLLARGRIFKAGPSFIGKQALESLESRVAGALGDYHSRFPLRAGMPRQEIRQAAMSRVDARVSGALLDLMIDRGTLELKGGSACLSGFVPTPNDREKKQALELLSGLRAGCFEPPPLAPGTDFEIVRYLESQGELVVLTRDMAFASGALKRAEELLRGYFEAGGQGLTVAGYRDILGASRRYSLALLNYFDQVGLTRRAGDLRHLRTREGGERNER